ncbi:hypothetical protein [Streptomyces pinistramenti]|uniref:hypothetical protein n=1 Tax=Streptomyces pinistramenti TaxID=2884812 RepID=UPI001D06D56C|nr:hypothetical protein [Streptomyces pinistramenti]MCB5907789.1 hypothetical protein [Streptomyces pinistramenti]
MEALIKKMAQDEIWQGWVAVNSAGAAAKNGCISATPKAGCISATPKSGCVSVAKAGCIS